MYPRNAASPERIAIGVLVQISDGAVQSTGETITVRGQGGAEAAGAGTTAYGASNVIYYTPTQAETNFTSFVVIASKAGCIPVVQTIVTTGSATPGTVLLAPVTHTGAVIPTVAALTGHTPQTADVAPLLGTPAGASLAADLSALKAVADGAKAKTDQLTFTKTNEIDANVQSINGVTITGNGSTGTEFGVV